MIAAYAGTTEIGRERAKVALAEIHGIFSPSGTASKPPPQPFDAREGRQLAETVRALSTDRERLLGRIATLERNLEDVTGSIARVEKAAQAAQQPPAAAIAAIPMPRSAPATPLDEVTSSVSPPAVPTPAPMPTPSPAPTRSEYGLDVGSAANVENLRTLWAATLRRYGPLLEGLRPVVQMRERRPGGMDLHLVVGPIPNAATAARLCATITAAGGLCHPSSYDGQRLALR
jgi:cell division septation protein DedD